MFGLVASEVLEGCTSDFSKEESFIWVDVYAVDHVCSRQWQAQNDEPISVEDWNNESKKKWFIIYSSEEMYAEYYYIMRLPNTIYFTNKEKAEEAIEVFKDELIWYFTEYVQRLDEVQND